MVGWWFHDVRFWPSVRSKNRPGFFTVLQGLCLHGYFGNVGVHQWFEASLVSLVSLFDCNLSKIVLPRGDVIDRFQHIYVSAISTPSHPIRDVATRIVCCNTFQESIQGGSATDLTFFVAERSCFIRFPKSNGESFCLRPPEFFCNFSERTHVLFSRDLYTLILTNICLSSRYDYHLMDFFHKRCVCVVAQNWGTRFTQKR